MFQMVPRKCITVLHSTVKATMWKYDRTMILSPGLVIEERGPDAALDFNKVTIKPVKISQCLFTGRVKVHNGSRLELSVCDGLSGY